MVLLQDFEFFCPQRFLVSNDVSLSCLHGAAEKGPSTEGHLCRGLADLVEHQNWSPAGHSANRFMLLSVGFAGDNLPCYSRSEEGK